MSSFFKDLIGKSYSERSQEEERANPSNPLSRENLFSSPASIGSSFGEDKDISISIYILDDSRRITGRTVRIDERIEEESKYALDTFNHVFREAFKPHMNDEHQSLSEFDYKRKSNPVKDYSMLVIELSKVLEIELNASIVEWINRNIKKKDLSVNNSEAAERETLPVSSLSDMEWEMDTKGCSSSSIGQITHHIFQYKDILSEKLNLLFSKEDIKLWKKLRDGRNASAHTGIVDEEDFAIYYYTFCEFAEKGWFTRLMDVKDLLKNNQKKSELL